MTYRYNVRAIAALLSLLLLLGGGFYWYSSEKTPADKIGISYGGGPFEGAQFQGVKNPGSGLFFNGPADKFYLYPVTQRDISVTSDGGAEDRDYGIPDEIEAKTSDGARCFVQLVGTFKINTNNIRTFHETISMKYKAWEDEGWGMLLFKNVFPSLSSAVQEQCRQFSTEEIAKDPTVLQRVADGVAADLKDNINAAMGVDDMFCGPEFVHGKPDCPEFEVVVKSITLPDSVTQSLEAQVVESNRSVTVQTKAANDKIAADGEKAAAEAKQQALTPEYLRSQEIVAMQTCAEAANGCVLVVTPGGSNVNVNAG